MREGADQEHRCPLPRLKERADDCPFVRKDKRSSGGVLEEDEEHLCCGTKGRGKWE
jgi:hypothetical protein